MTKYRVESIKVGKANLNETINIIESINLVKNMKKVDILKFYGFINDIITNFFNCLHNINIKNIALFTDFEEEKIIIKFELENIGISTKNNYIVLNKIVVLENTSWNYNFYTIDKKETNFNSLFCYTKVGFVGILKQNIEDIKTFEELIKKCKENKKKELEDYKFVAENGEKLTLDRTEYLSNLLELDLEYYIRENLTNSLKYEQIQTIKELLEIQFERQKAEKELEEI